MMKIQELLSLRLLRLLLLVVMGLAAVNLGGYFLDISNQLKLYRNMFKGKTLELATFRREETKQTTYDAESEPESTKTITKHTVIRLNHRLSVTQPIQNTIQKINTNIMQVKAQLVITQPEVSAFNTEKQQTQNETQRPIERNTTIQSKYSVKTKDIILNNQTDESTHQRLQNDSSSITQNTTRLVPSNEDEKINISATMNSTLNENIPMPYCKRPSDLGPISANKSLVELNWVETLYPEVDRGGMYFPPNCTAKHRVAIFVTYRDREDHLAIFLRHIHPFLIKQQLEYGIYVVEQLGNSDFNKGILYNAVFLEAQALRPVGWDCFVFHDIDLLPLDLRNMYSCPKHPKHMSVAVDTLDNRLMYRYMFGGVTALSAAQFLKVNGYSNMYWGWGGEDDDMSKRLRHQGYVIRRINASIARYTMLPHKRRRPNPNRIRILNQAIKKYLHDGLTNVKYDLVDIVRHHLYTLIQIDVDRYANDTFIVKATTVPPNVTKETIVNVNTTIVPASSN